MGEMSLLDESSGTMAERHGCYADHSVSIGQMVFGTKERRGRESLEMQSMGQQIMMPQTQPCSMLDGSK